MTPAQDSTFFVIGLATRTDNDAESDPNTARLPDLWARALRDPLLTERRGTGGAGLVAVLTDYESDHTGSYTQVVGVRADSPADLPERMVAVAVPGRDRHHLPAHGPIPEALIGAWQTVWQQSAAGEIARAYETDYEVHGPEGADLYVSVTEV